MEEIPFEKFAKLGISRERFMAMPRELIDPLLNGQITPLVRAKIRAKNHKVIEMPMKLQLTRDDDGKVLLQTYELRKEVDNEFKLTDRELERVRKGEIVKKELKDKNEKRLKFIQLDPETLSLISRNVAQVKITQKLRDMEKINDIELGVNQKQAAQDGKPIELNVGDQKVTVGVDLHEPLGYKVVNGDMNEWERQVKIKYDQEHEGFMGYLMTDENRWEYNKVVENLSRSQHTDNSLEKEKKSGIKL